MLSRVADALYWLGRYLERAEIATRLLLVTEDFATETQALAEDLAQTAWKDLGAIFPGAGPATPVAAAAPLAMPYLAGFFVDHQNPYSVHYSLRKARENARAVREALTVEVFVALNEAYRALDAQPREGLADLPALRDGLTATHRRLFGIVGAIESTLTRDEGWHFLRLGTSLERVYRTAMVLRAKLPALLVPAPAADLALQHTQWRTLLRALASLESYRRVGGARLEGEPVVAFLLFDADAPRSLRHGTGAVKECVEHIAGPVEPGPAARLVGRLYAELCYGDARRATADLAGFLDGVLDQIGRTHDALAVQYFVT